MESAYFGGGCFWCTEAVFKRVKGVDNVVPGYAGGHTPNPGYRDVCSGLTGHAELIRIDFDPSVIGYDDLLLVFFTTHDPTTLNRQGNDVGSQYRSIIFYTDDQQKLAAERFMAEEGALMWEDRIVTELVPLEKFHEAEPYHHDYYARNTQQAYCSIVIRPKIAKLESKLSELLKHEK